MKTLSANLIIAAGCCIIFSSCNDDSGTAKKSELPEGIVLGMVKEERNKLAGIPLASTPFGGTELPESIDLSEGMPEAGNQGGQQSCVAWAVAYALKSYQEKMELGEQMNFSPSFIYNQINNGQNVPTYITDALNVLSEQGVCFLDEMPYKEDDWKTKPSQTARESAKRFRIDYWRQVNVQDVKEVKAQLHAGLPVIIGSEVTYEFVKEGLNNEDFIWKEKGTSAGGHAMLLVGYDDQKNAFKVMNSWGKEWGDNGFGWIDYELFPNVTWYGFVAKDAYTAPETIANKNISQQKEDDKNYYNNDNYYHNQEINPRDNPNAFDTINFHHEDVQHNVLIQGDEIKGKAMKITGSIDLPSRFGKKFQVAVHIYDAATNQQVKSLMYPDYADVDGFAAKATPLTDIGENGFRGTWWINIPYRAVDFPPGKSDFYAIPSLFVDNFGVAFGEPIKFWIRKTN